VKGSEILTHDGMPVGYALCPTETVSIILKLLCALQLYPTRLIQLYFSCFLLC